MHPLHISIGSTTSKPGAVAENLRQIDGFAEQAARDGADLLLTPELSASGYGSYPDVIATAEPAGDGPIFAALAGMAARTGVVVCAGFVEASDHLRHIAHVAVYPDGRFVVQRKHRVTLTERPLDPCVALSGHPPGAADPADPGQPMEPPRFQVFDVCGVRCALVICADAGIAGLNDLLAASGVQVMLLPTGAGGKREDRVTTDELRTDVGRVRYLKVLETVFFPGAAITDCIRYRRALAAVNLCGWDGRQHHHVGHGMIINPMGEVPALFHGIPNLDRQRPMYAHAIVGVGEAIAEATP